MKWVSLLYKFMYEKAQPQNGKVKTISQCKYRKVTI